MDKKEEEKKGINLMPEDLRSKESGLLSKVKAKADFGHDLVVPQAPDIKKVDYKEKTSFFDSIKKLFNRPKSFGEPHHKHKETKEEHKPDTHKKEPKNKDPEPKKDDMVMHVPDKDLIKSDLTVNYKDSILGDVQEPKKSIWQQLKNLFSPKGPKVPQVPQAPKIERVPEKPIVPKELSEQPSDTVKTEEPVDILDDKNIKTIPELKTPDIKPMDVPQAPQENVDALKTPEVKKGTDFYIPNLDTEPAKEVKKELPREEPQDDHETKSILKKFHTPEKRIKARFLDDGGGVDLIPDAVKVRSWRQIVHLLLITVFSFAFVIAIFYGFLYYKNDQIIKQKEEKDKQITDIEGEIYAYKELNYEIADLGKEIKNIHRLLSLHFYWTNFFQLLEKYTIDGVYYENMTAGNGGAMTLESRANSFETLSKQIKILNQEEAKEFVQQVNVSSAEYDETQDEVAFNMTILLNPSLFLYNENYIYEYSLNDTE